MLVDEDGEEEDDEGEWAEYEAQQAAWASQEDEKGTSSKDSSYLPVEPTKDSPKDEAHPQRKRLQKMQVKRQRMQTQRQEKIQKVKTSTFRR